MRIVTVTPNAAVDTTWVLERFVPGAINRVARSVAAPGGKGNNVARVLAALGRAPTATGFVAGHGGRRIADGLRAEGIEPAFVEVAGESRVCLTVVETATGRVSELREPGAPVGEEDGERLVARVVGLARGADAVVVSGSLAPGLPADYYARLLGALRETPAYVAFDSSGEALRLGLGGRPDVIKPNAEELAELLGVEADPGVLVAAARWDLLGPILAPASAVLLTLGAAGAVLVRRERAWRAAAPAVAAANTVGCGDALLAGWLDARGRGADDPGALAHAVAVGSAAALQEGIGVVDRADVARLGQEVRVEDATG